MDQEKLGKFLLTLRKEKELKQKDVAKQLCVTAQAISKWERGLGLPDISLWNGICEVYEISLIELLNGEKEEKPKTKKEEKINDLLKDTINHSNDKINKMELKVVLLLIGLAISIYTVSLVFNSTILNYILFAFSSVVVIYSLGIVFKKWSYLKRFLTITIILISIILGYSFLEKISLNRIYRTPIFSIKEIYKEYNITVYKSIFYSAYSCDDANGDLSLLGEKKIEDVCANGHLTDSDDKTTTLKSGAVVSQEQLFVLQYFQDELLKHGFVDYNYMRETDLKSFWNYIDENHYCSNNYNEDTRLVIKRKDGVCQYNNAEFYYCIIPQEDGVIKYKKTDNRSCY